MIYLVYLALAIAVVLLAVRLSYYVDVLDRKTNLSGAFIGGVMLAAVTSLPELFTALTAVIALDRPQLVQGDIFGSNVFNLCVIGVLILFTYQNYRRSSLSKTHKSTIIYSLIMYALAFIGMLKPMEISLGVLNVNLMSILILVVYGINVLFMKNDESAENENEDNCHLSVIYSLQCFLGLCKYFIDPCDRSSRRGIESRRNGSRSHFPRYRYLIAGIERIDQFGSYEKLQCVLRQYCRKQSV